MSERALTSLAVDAVLPAAPEVVFRALTEPDLYAQWMGPEGSTTTIEEMHAVPGGRLSFVVALASGPRVRLSGTYTEVDAPRRLVHTWQAEGDDLATTVTIVLNRLDDGTHLVLTHDGFTDEADRSRNRGGWEHQLERLTALVAVTG